jgi:Inovirus Coat protein B
MSGDAVPGRFPRFGVEMFKRSFVGGSLLALVGLANAAVPASITTAIADMQADGVTVATAFVVAAIAVAAVKFLRSAK